MSSIIKIMKKPIKNKYKTPFYLKKYYVLHFLHKKLKHVNTIFIL